MTKHIADPIEVFSDNSDEETSNKENSDQGNSDKKY